MMIEGGVSMQTISRAEVAQRVASSLVAMVAGGDEGKKAVDDLANWMSANEVLGLSRMLAHDRVRCGRCGFYAQAPLVSDGQCAACNRATGVLTYEQLTRQS